MFENIQLYFLLIKKKLAGENTSVLIILAITIYIYIYIYIYIMIGGMACFTQSKQLNP